jgi:flagellar biosynthesis protein
MVLWWSVLPHLEGMELPEIAEEHNIPLKRDPALIEVLFQLDLDQEIPTELYQAVAEVLAYLCKMTGKLS